jgi:hypothetical protein
LIQIDVEAATDPYVFTPHASLTSDFVETEHSAYIFTPEAVGHVPEPNREVDVEYRFRPMASAVVLAAACVSLGRFRRGDVVSVELSLPFIPDVPPYGVVLDSEHEIVQAFLLSRTSSSPGDFTANIFVDRQYQFGHHQIAFVTLAGGVPEEQDNQCFDVISGGDSGGRVVSLACYQRGASQNVLAHLSSGELVLGREPSLDFESPSSVPTGAEFPGPFTPIASPALGRFRHGDVAPLFLSLSYVPDTSPFVAILDQDNNPVHAFQMSRTADNPGDFALDLFMDQDYPFGDYRAVFAVTAAGSQRAQLDQPFSVIPGGDTGGGVLSLACYQRDRFQGVLAQLGNGDLVLGESPSLDLASPVSLPSGEEYEMRRHRTRHVSAASRYVLHQAGTSSLSGGNTYNVSSDSQYVLDQTGTSSLAGGNTYNVSADSSYILSPASFQGGNLYYVSPAAGSGGAGTIGDPWKLGDLLDPTTWAIGVALTTPQAGDTLIFRGGTVTINDTNVGASHQPYIHPLNSGTVLAPITLRSYPGEAVTITATGQTGGGIHRPLIGTASGGPTHVRFLGFTLQASNDTIGGTVYCAEVATISTTGIEIGFCEMIGTTIAGSNVGGTDNHSLLWVASGGGYVHHNVLHDNYGPSGHGQCLITWNTDGTTLYEDNHIYQTTPDVNSGCALEKGSGSVIGAKHSIWRRNWLQNHGLPAWAGQLEAAASVFSTTIEFYDNVVEGTVSINGYQTGSQYYNNLLDNLYLYNGVDQTSFSGASGPAKGCAALSLWNNIAIGTVTNIDCTFNHYNLISPEPAYAFTYFDYNGYAHGTPRFGFNGQSSFDLTWWQGQGHELNAIVVSLATAFYPNSGSGDWALSPTYATAGRYGDAIGPRVAISGAGGIMDPTRYGPGALP